MENPKGGQQREKSYGTIAIATERRTIAKKGKTVSYFKFLRTCVRCSLFLLVVGFVALASHSGPDMYSKYQGLSQSMQRVLDGKFHLLKGGELVVRQGDKLNAEELKERLQSLQYTRSNQPSPDTGHFIFSDNSIIFSPHSLKDSKTVRIDFAGGIVQLITSAGSGQIVQKVALGRPVLTSFEKSIWEVRYPVNNALPAPLKEAIVATEDRSFFTHHGIDVKGIGRAAMVNIRKGSVVQGGSTITQQLVKTLVGRTGRDFGAKIEEVVLAVAIDFFYTKEEILQAYCNTIYMGRVGPFALHGMQAAARHLLQKDITELQSKDCALLAGLIRSPNYLSPLRHPERAIARANIVLRQMQEVGGVAEPLLLEPYSLVYLDQKSPELIPLSWYYQQVQKELKPFMQDSLRETLTIETGLDPYLQQDAQLQMNQQLAELEKRKGLRAGQLQSGLAAVDVESGRVRALIGGRDYNRSQFNRAVDANRQIGSLVKPFVYMTAMAALPDGVLYQAQQVDDLPLTRRISGKYWRPGNYDHKYLGRMSWRKALALSRNTPAVRVGESVGVEPVRQTLMQLGINRSPGKGPAIFLGAVESSPLRMAAAYRSIGAEGDFVKPFFIEKILDGDAVVYKTTNGKKLFEKKQTEAMASILGAVMTEGTGKSVNKYKLRATVAGKTGTSNDLNDGWFAGFSSDLVMAVWVGRDSNSKMGYTGATSALPIWAKLMQNFGGETTQPFFEIAEPPLRRAETALAQRATPKPVTPAVIQEVRISPLLVAKRVRKISHPVARKHTVTPSQKQALQLAHKQVAQVYKKQTPRVVQKQKIQVAGKQSSPLVKKQRAHVVRNQPSLPQKVGKPGPAPVAKPVVASAPKRKTRTSGRATPLAHQSYRFFN